jgi:hypothetical protein
MIQELMPVATMYGLAETYELYRARLGAVDSHTDVAAPAVGTDRV